MLANDNYEATVPSDTAAYFEPTAVATPQAYFDPTTPATDPVVYTTVDSVEPAAADVPTEELYSDAMTVAAGGLDSMMAPVAEQAYFDPSLQPAATQDLYAQTW